MERTYIMIKPDGVQRGLIGRIISRFEDRGFRLAGLKMLHAQDETLEEHYAELKVGRWTLSVMIIILIILRSVHSSPG